MPSATNISRWVLVALALGCALAQPGAAQAALPTATDFQITYRFTDEGEVLLSQRLVQNDLNRYVNRARCQCDVELAAQVFLKPAQTSPYTQSQIRTYVGSNCDQGQQGNSLQYRPCVRVAQGLPTEYDDGGQQIIFPLAFLSSSASSLDDQAAESAVLVDPCAPSQTGDGGIWICVEDGMKTDCQTTEFIITGTQNQNTTGTSGGTGSTDPSMGMTASGALHFDYLPPQVSVTGFRASAGDGAVEIGWDATESTDLSGFRVLCADVDGNAVPGKGASEPTGSQRALGQLYFTADNLCPGAVVYGADEDPTTSGSDTDGTGDGTTMGDGTTAGDGTTMGEGTTGDGTTAMGAVGPILGDGWSQATAGSTTDPGSTGASDDTGRGSDSAGSGTAGSDTGTSGVDIGDSPLASLDWKYVCSAHVSRTGTSTRVEGLENGKEYQFIVVAYDLAGNPLIVSDLLTETPAETSDFWEQCERQGDLCGSGGFCACTSDPAPTGAVWLGTGLLLLGLSCRRRRLRP